MPLSRSEPPRQSLRPVVPESQVAVDGRGNGACRDGDMRERRRDGEEGCFYTPLAALTA